MERIRDIVPADQAAADRAAAKWGRIAKPLHSLGIPERQITDMAAVFGSEDYSIKKRCAVCICGDHGVVEEGVAQSDCSVTAAVARAVAAGTSNINIMARSCGADVFAADLGMAMDVECDGLIDMKISHGTANMTKGPAMTRELAERAVSCGMDLVKMCSQKGYMLIASGEMGIGNTTAAAAISSVILGLSPEEVTGRGAGLDSEGLIRKIATVKRAIAVNQPDRNDPMDVLSKLGGYDIAGMTGLFLGGAYYHIPVIIDGVISAAAAAIAAMICPAAKDYMLCSHTSAEPAAKGLLSFIGKEAPITAGLRLGEGTGAVLLMPMLDAVKAVYDSEHSFENINVERYRELK